MKKIFVCLMLLFVLIPCFAFAEGEIAEAVVEIVENEIPVEPVSWDQLATVAGCAMMTMLIVQLLKLPLDKVWKIPTRIIVFFISFVIMLTATYFKCALNTSTAVLTIFNAVISALTAMGGYELTFAKLEKKNTES